MATNGNGNGFKVAGETVKALSGTPMLLVLLVLNMLILGMITYLLKVRAAGMQAEKTELIETLSRCMERLDHGP